MCELTKEELCNHLRQEEAYGEARESLIQELVSQIALLEEELRKHGDWQKVLSIRKETTAHGEKK